MGRKYKHFIHLKHLDGFNDLSVKDGSRRQPKDLVIKCRGLGQFDTVEIESSLLISQSGLMSELLRSSALVRRDGYLECQSSVFILPDVCLTDLKEVLNLLESGEKIVKNLEEKDEFLDLLKMLGIEIDLVDIPWLRGVESVSDVDEVLGIEINPFFSSPSPIGRLNPADSSIDDKDAAEYVDAHTSISKNTVEGRLGSSDVLSIRDVKPININLNEGMDRFTDEDIEVPVVDLSQDLYISDASVEDLISPHEESIVKTIPTNSTKKERHSTSPNFGNLIANSSFNTRTESNHDDVELCDEDDADSGVESNCSSANLKDRRVGFDFGIHFEKLTGPEYDGVKPKWRCLFCLKSKIHSVLSSKYRNEHFLTRHVPKETCEKCGDEVVASKVVKHSLECDGFIRKKCNFCSSYFKSTYLSEHMKRECSKNPNRLKKKRLSRLKPEKCKYCGKIMGSGSIPKHQRFNCPVLNELKKKDKEEGNVESTC